MNTKRKDREPPRHYREGRKTYMIIGIQGLADEFLVPISWRDYLKLRLIWLVKP
jgi:hypothetical protein